MPHTNLIGLTALVHAAVYLNAHSLYATQRGLAIKVILTRGQGAHAKITNQTIRALVVG